MRTTHRKDRCVGSQSSCYEEQHCTPSSAALEDSLFVASRASVAFCALLARYAAFANPDQIPLILTHHQACMIHGLGVALPAGELRILCFTTC